MQEHRLAAIMFTDIVGYTALMGSDEDRAFEVLAKNREIHLNLLEQFKSTLIKEMGDGMLISFDLASDAVRCAIEIQKVCKGQNIPLKIGIHEGEVVFAGADVLGDGVNVASRIESLAVAGSVLISEKVYDEIKNQEPIKASFLNTFKLKNVEIPIKVYAISNAGLIVPKPENIISETDPGLAYSFDRQDKPVSKIRKGVTLAISITTIVAILILVYLKFGLNPNASPKNFERSIAVMPFKNITGDSIYNLWQDGLQNLLITSLSNSEELRITQYETMYGILEKGANINYASITPTLAGEVAKRLEANTVIMGNVHKFGNRVRITANIMDAGTEEIFKSYEMDGTTEDDFFILIDSLSMLIRNFLEIKSLKQSLAFDLNNVYTNSAEAYKLYLQGLNCHTRLDINCAVELLSKAIEIDSGFVSAMMQLAYCYGNLRQAEMSKFWAYKAIERMDQLTPDMQLRVREIKAAVDKKPLEQIKHIKLCLEINPNSTYDNYMLGWVYFNTKQWQEAIGAFEKTMDLSERFEMKTWAWTYLLLGGAYHYIDNHKEEEKIFSNGHEQWPEQKSQFDYWQAVCAISRGDSVNTQIYLEEIRKMCEQKGWPRANLLIWYAGAHERAESLSKAKEYYEEALTLSPDNKFIMHDVAHFLISNDIDIDKGLKLIETVIEQDPQNGTYLYTYGMAFFKTGALEKSLEILNQSWDLKPYYDHEHFILINRIKETLSASY